MSRRTKADLAPAEPVDRVIREVRGERVVLDFDLARLYGVKTAAMNQAVKRNRDRFPPDFLFRLNRREWELVNRSQIVTGSHKHRDPRLTPHAFTEHGAIMAANLLNSPQAVQMSIYVIRAFIKMRAALAGQADLARRLAEIERAVIGQDAALRDLYEKIRPLLLTPPDPGRREIGFHVREPREPDAKTGGRRSIPSRPSGRSLSATSSPR